MGRQLRWRLTAVVGVGALACFSGLASIVPAAQTDAATASGASIGSFTLAQNAGTIAQNTRASDLDTIITGAATPASSSGSSNATVIDANNGSVSGWSFSVSDGWQSGDTISITVAPASGSQSAVPARLASPVTSSSCATSYPVGVNQTLADGANYLGFPNFNSGDTPIGKAGTGQVTPAWPEITTDSSGSKPPTFRESLSDPITTCAGSDIPQKVFSTLTLTFTNAGSAKGTTYDVGLGYALGSTNLNVGAIKVGPLAYNVGLSAATGPVAVSATYASATATKSLAVPSNATVVGETPNLAANPVGLVRNATTDAVSGAVPNITITENSTKGAAVPPLENGGLPANAMTAGLSAPGDVCLMIDNHDGSQLAWNTTAGAAGWAVKAVGGSSDNARVGTASVIAKGVAVANDTLQLPVMAASNTNSVFTAGGLSLTGTASADGPVYAYLYWSDGGCTKAKIGLEGTGTSANSILGYLQIATVSDLAPSVFGATQDATAAQALEHQFNASVGQCVTNQYPNYAEGPSVFLATNASWYDGLGASYAAGQIDSGVLFTGPTGSVDPATLQALKVEGVETVYVVGGTVAIAQSEISQLQSTPSYLCGGTQQRQSGGQVQNLNVLTPFAGQTFYDTNELLAEFTGARTHTTAATNLSTYNQTPYPFIDPACTECGRTAYLAGPNKGVNTALLVTDDTFQDGISASIPAYDSHFPLIETDPGGLSSQAVATLVADKVGQVIIVGGGLAVSDNVFGQLTTGDNGQFPPISVLRVAGVDASDTSAELAAFELSSSPGANGSATQTLGLGYDNLDVNWNYFVSQTTAAGTTPSATATFTPTEGAHVVLLARGDYYTDAEGAGAELSYNDQAFFCAAVKQKKTAGPPGSSGGCTDNFFPLLLTEDPNTLGPYVTSFLNNAGLSVSMLGAEAPAFGWWGPQATTKGAALSGDTYNIASSNGYTLQPIGGPVALTPALLNSALNQVTAG